MSEIAAPPAVQPRPQYDFLRPLTFVFEDPRWLPKLLLGALFSLAGIILIGIFFVYGYLARLVRNVVAGEQTPLPEWDDLGEMFSEGAMLFVATLIYTAPFFFLFFLMFPFSMLADMDNAAAQFLGGGGLVVLGLVFVPFALALAVWVPAAMLHAIVKRDFRAAFDFRTIGLFLRGNALNYLLAYLDWLVARFAAGFGILLCCVGIFITSFWALAVAGAAFAQVYRLSENK
ncbi:MAG TPA: DUF4013 domain-containing protein [Thermoanaerobaculia bacterium]|nr:DUF4013 domain-containing protein [Thermoanaerobaculia bacterium]